MIDLDTAPGAGWVFGNDGGGWEYPAFWAIAHIALAPLGAGAYAVKIPFWRWSDREDHMNFSGIRECGHLFKQLSKRSCQMSQSGLQFLHQASIAEALAFSIEVLKKTGYRHRGFQVRAEIRCGLRGHG